MIELAVAVFGVLGGGLVAFVVWMKQQLHTRNQVRRVLVHDVREHRHTLILMANFFEGLQERIQRKEAKKFHFRNTDFAVYHGLIPQIPLLNEKEVDVITAFYETYKVFEGIVLALSDTLRQWDDLRAQDEEISDFSIQAASYALVRIMKLKELLLENTSGNNIANWSENYREPFERCVTVYKAKVLEQQGIPLL